MEVRQLRHHTDRTDDGERRGQYLIGDARHHVATAGRDLIDRDRQLDAGRAQSRQLRSCQTIAMHHAAFAVELQQHLDSERSEEHTSELQSLMRTSYAVFCLKKTNTTTLYYPL